MEVRRLDDALPAAGRLGMDGDLDAGMTDADSAVGHDHRDALADEAPWHAVAVAVDLDRAVGLHASRELADLPKGRPTVERSQRRCLIALEAKARGLSGCAVLMEIGNFPHPPGKMRLERRP